MTTGLLQKVNCLDCLDSLWIWQGIKGPQPCHYCEEYRSANAAKVGQCITDRVQTNQLVDYHSLRIASLLIKTSTDAPVERIGLEQYLGLNERDVMGVIRFLRRGWLLPICGRRQKPNGYWLAQSIKECEEWFNTSRSQALDELSTIYKIQRANFPEFAGQTAFAFIDEFSEEFREVVK